MSFFHATKKHTNSVLFGGQRYTNKYIRKAMRVNYAAVIAAAGLSSRMREFKPLLCFGNETMISTVIRNLREAGVGEIVVVTGYKAELMRHYLKDFHVTICENPRYAETQMYDSLCLGLRALTQPCDYVFVMPGDVPLVQPETIRRMMEVSCPMSRPVCCDRPGHPVMFSKEVLPRLLDHDGQNGLRGAMGSLGIPITEIPVDDEGVLVDVDTPEDLKPLYKKGALLRNGGKLWPDIQIHIAKGDAVLTPETAQYLEMIVHTGSIQSACSCMHMSYTKGWKLLNKIEKELGYPLVERFPGGISGGGSVLTVRGKHLLSAYQTYRTELQAAANKLFQEIFDQELNL